jgi:hypothetical protein
VAPSKALARSQGVIVQIGGVALRRAHHHLLLSRGVRCQGAIEGEALMKRNHQRLLVFMEHRQVRPVYIVANSAVVERSFT